MVTLPRGIEIEAVVIVVVGGDVGQGDGAGAAIVIDINAIIADGLVAGDVGQRNRTVADDNDVVREVMDELVGTIRSKHSDRFTEAIVVVDISPVGNIFTAFHGVQHYCAAGADK